MTTQTSKKTNVGREEHIDRAAKRVHEITEKLADLSDDALNKVEDSVDRLRDQTKEYSKDVEGYIQQHPLKSVGLAALSGAILAVIFRGRH